MPCLACGLISRTVLRYHRAAVRHHIGRNAALAAAKAAAVLRQHPIHHQDSLFAVDGGKIPVRRKAIADLFFFGHIGIHVVPVTVLLCLAKDKADALIHGFALFGILPRQIVGRIDTNKHRAFVIQCASAIQTSVIDSSGKRGIVPTAPGRNNIQMPQYADDVFALSDLRVAVASVCILCTESQLSAQCQHILQRFSRPNTVKGTIFPVVSYTLNR